MTVEGEKVSHAVIRSQSSGMPSVMGISGIWREGNVLHLPEGGQLREGDWIVVDGDRRRVILTDETDVLEPSRLIKDASLRLEEVQGIEEQIQNRWGKALYEEVLEEYVDASKNLERIKGMFPSISQSELDTANVRLHALHLIAWEKGAEQEFSHGRVNRDIATMKHLVLKSVIAEDAFGKGEASIVLVEDSSMVDRTGEKHPTLERAKALFGTQIEQNRTQAEEIRRAKYSDYPSHENVSFKKTIHHDGSGGTYFTHIIYVNVPLGRVGDEGAKGSFSVNAQNMKYQNIVEGLGSGSPDIIYDEVHRKHRNFYSIQNVDIQWWPKTEGQNDTHLSFTIKSPSGQNLTITEGGNSTSIQFGNQPAKRFPLLSLRSLFKSKDTVFLVVSPDFLRFLVENGIPSTFSDGKRGDPSYVRIVNSTVAPAIKMNIQERAARDYLEKDHSVLQEFKKEFWDPLLSTLTPDQRKALIRLTLSYELRSCFHTMPPFLLLNHGLFRELVPGMSPEKWEDKLYLEGIREVLIRSVKMEGPETMALLELFHDPSPPSPELRSFYYSSLVDLFQAFQRAGANFPQKLDEMIFFMKRVKYSPPWDDNGLFRVAAGLLPEEKKAPPSSESDGPATPPQNKNSGLEGFAKADAMTVGTLLREASKDNFEPLLNESLLPMNQPLQALLGTGGAATQQETAFDRIKRYQENPAYVGPFKEKLKSELANSGILADANLGYLHARVLSLNQDNLASVQAEIDFRGTLNKIFEGLGLRDQGHPLFHTIVTPTSNEAVRAITQLRVVEFLGTYVAVPQLEPGEKLTIPKLAKSYEELKEKGLNVSVMTLVPLNRMDNLDLASLSEEYKSTLENMVKTMVGTAKDLPELRRVSQEIKSFLRVIKAIAEMA
ncbi:MAG: hypothetical protein IPN90_07910 [Elusimicrobia bacterium]|nr:hypothetical protein [Elusimicrobiota bacterium]